MLLSLQIEQVLKYQTGRESKTNQKVQRSDDFFDELRICMSAKVMQFKL